MCVHCEFTSQFVRVCACVCVGVFVSSQVMTERRHILFGPFLLMF